MGKAKAVKPHLKRKPSPKGVKPSLRRKPKKEILINLGCGVGLLSGFINVDKHITEEMLREGIKTKAGLCANAVYPRDAVFVQGDILDLPFDDNYADYIECIEMLEHLPFRDVQRAVAEVFRVLKPGGEAVFFVPDMDDLAQVWLERVKGKQWDPATYFGLIQQFFGNQIHAGEYHTSGFTGNYLQGMLQAIGFSKVTVEHYYHDQHPPEFRGAKWDLDKILIVGILYATVTK